MNTTITLHFLEDNRVIYVVDRSPDLPTEPTSRKLDRRAPALQLAA